MTHTLGADPEFFIETQDGTLKSIVGLIGGTKQNPKIIDNTGGFKIQEDNVAAEYNIPPSNTKEEFIDNILWPQEYIANLLSTKNFKINTKASAYFPKKELLDPKAQEFGCEPDYNAWAMEVNEKPSCQDKTFRTCGGHVHFSCENNIERLVQDIRNMDKTLGVWSVIRDPDVNRRMLYGKPGSFRPQKHGGEYRVLSNFWIFSPELIGEVWDRAQLAFLLGEIDQKEGEIIQNIINTGDTNAARKYLRFNGLS